MRVTTNATMNEFRMWAIGLSRPSYGFDWRGARRDMAQFIRENRHEFDATTRARVMHLVNLAQRRGE